MCYYECAKGFEHWTLTVKMHWKKFSDAKKISVETSKIKMKGAKVIYSIPKVHGVYYLLCRCKNYVYYMVCS